MNGGFEKSKNREEGGGKERRGKEWEREKGGRKIRGNMNQTEERKI